MNTSIYQMDGGQATNRIVPQLPESHHFVRFQKKTIQHNAKQNQYIACFLQKI